MHFGFTNEYGYETRTKSMGLLFDDPELEVIVGELVKNT
jgi:hypothetical protein